MEFADNVVGRKEAQIAKNRRCFAFHFSSCPIQMLLLAFLFLCVNALAESPKLDKVTLQLKWKHQFQFAGYYAAEEKGYYKEAGLDVTFIEARPGVDPAVEVIEGRADFGVAGPSLLLLRDDGKPVVILAAIFQHSPLVLMMRDDREIADIRALNGKKIMIEPLSSDIITYLQSEKVDIGSLKIVPHNFNVQDLIDGKVDAMTAYTTTEPYFMRQMKIPYKLFSPQANCIDFYGDCLFTTEKNIKLHPARVEAFREASLRGWKYAMEHPEEIITTILWKYDSKRSKEHLHFEAVEMRALIQPNVIEIGYMNPSRWRQIVNTYKQSGQISKNIPVETFIYSAKTKNKLSTIAYLHIGFALILVLVFSVILLRFKKLNSALSREIQLRDLAENKLQETKSVFETAFDHSPVGIVIAKAPDGVLQYINSAAHKALGNPIDEAMVGMDTAQFAPDDQSLHLDGAKIASLQGPLALAILRGKMISKEFTSQSSNGTKRQIWVDAAPVFNKDGTVKAGVAVIQDITERGTPIKPE